jgi:hypothetical protein
MGEGLKRARAAAKATSAAPKKITRAKAARLVAIIAELQECEDCPSGLSIALEDARAEISPWYDDEGWPMDPRDHQNIPLGSIANLDAKTTATVLRDYETLILPAARLDLAGLRILRGILDDAEHAITAVLAEIAGEAAEDPPAPRSCPNCGVPLCPECAAAGWPAVHVYTGTSCVNGHQVPEAVTR